MSEGGAVRAKRKYNQVVEAARDVFMEFGYHGASVDEVARRAKISKATLYRYFDSKAELFTEIALAEIAQQTAVGAEAVSAKTDPREILTSIGTGYSRFILSSLGTDLYRIVAAERHRFPEVAAAFYEQGRVVVRKQLVDYFEKAEAEGKLKVNDKDLAAAQLIEMCRSDLLARALFLGEAAAEADIDRAVTSGVELFMSHYGA